MSISKRRGLIKLPKNVYDEGKCIDAFSGLKVQVFRIEYEAFTDRYSIWFTSPYVDETEECIDIPEYTLYLSTYGFYFEKAIF